MIPKQRFIPDFLLLCMRPIGCRFRLHPSLHCPVLLSHQRFYTLEPKLTPTAGAGGGTTRHRHIRCRDEHSRATRKHDLAIEKQDVSRQDQHGEGKMTAGNVHSGFRGRVVVRSIALRTLPQPRNKREMCLFDSCPDRQIQLARKHSEQQCERRD